MSQKAIYLQSQGLTSPTISKHKEVSFCSICVDNTKITIEAYDGDFPRINSLIKIVDKNEVFELTPEKLIDILHFYHEFAPNPHDVIRYKNSHHHIMPDALKK